MYLSFNFHSIYELLLCCFIKKSTSQVHTVFNLDNEVRNGKKTQTCIICLLIILLWSYEWIKKVWSPKGLDLFLSYCSQFFQELSKGLENGENLKYEAKIFPLSTFLAILTYIVNKRPSQDLRKIKEIA